MIHPVQIQIAKQAAERFVAAAEEYLSRAEDGAKVGARKLHDGPIRRAAEELAAALAELKMERRGQGKQVV